MTKSLVLRTFYTLRGQGNRSTVQLNGRGRCTCLCAFFRAYMLPCQHIFAVDLQKDIEKRLLNVKNQAHGAASHETYGGSEVLSSRWLATNPTAARYKSYAEQRISQQRDTKPTPSGKTYSGGISSPEVRYIKLTLVQRHIVDPQNSVAPFRTALPQPSPLRHLRNPTILLSCAL